MIPVGDRSGAFADTIDCGEQRALFRSLRALACVFCGPRSAELFRYLAQAKSDPAALEPASDALYRLAATDRRNVLASFTRLTQPA